MNEMSEVLSMLFECLDLWVPPVFRVRESWLCHPSREGLAWVFEWMLGSRPFSQYC